MGIKFGGWKYKNSKVTLLAMIWLGGTYMFLLFFINLFAFFGNYVVLILLGVFSIFYGIMGVQFNEKGKELEIWEELNVSKGWIFFLYNIRTIAAFFGFLAVMSFKTLLPIL